MSTIKALLVQPGDTGVSDYELPVEGQLQALQGLVGGYIEAAYSADQSVTFWINEEGKIHDLPVNGFGTALWWLVNPAVRNRDTLRGPVLITGGADGQGDTLPIPDDVVVAFKDLYLEGEK